ncbi:MAG TPA: cytochrome c3 family protein [Armatimonadota bacterium]|nr:cytochrome c3 family protein [Armatimonadota bacterium]
MTAEARVTAGTILVLLIGLTMLTIFYGSTSGIIVYNAPAQPIDFFHRVHAGDKGISCYFCHRTAATAAFAGMPSTETCMRCHRVVIPHHYEIQRLHRYWKNREPVPWVRVNQLPGFVFFDHKAHILNGVKCDYCHGKVITMDRLHQAAPLSMGWCVACHRAHKAPDDCWTCHR